MSRTMKRICWISLIVAGIGLILALTMFFAGANVAARVSADGVELVGGPLTDTELGLVIQTDLEQIASLDIRVDSADVQVVEGDGYALEMWSYQTAGGYQLSYEYRDGSLTIWDNLRGQRDSWQIQFGLYFPQAWINPGNNRVIITLPADAVLDATNISCDMGAVSAWGVSAESVSVSASFGSIALADTRADSVDLRLSSGQLALDGIEAGELRVKNSFGTIELRGTGEHISSVSVDGDSCIVALGGFSAGSLDIRDSFGRVQLSDLILETLTVSGSSCDVIADRVSAAAAEIRNDFGAVTAANWSSGALEINASSCTVDIAGSLRGKTTVDNSFGAISLRSDLPRDEYSLDVGVDFGKISIDGASAGGEYRETADGQANRIEISNSSGDVVLQFGDSGGWNYEENP